MIVPLLEALDLVGELSLAEIFTEKPTRRAIGQDPIQALEDRLGSLLGDLRLDDDGKFVFPHSIPPPGRTPEASEPLHEFAPGRDRAIERAEGFSDSGSLLSGSRIYQAAIDTSEHSLQPAPRSRGEDDGSDHRRRVPDGSCSPGFAPGEPALGGRPPSVGFRLPGPGPGSGEPG